MAPAAPDQKSVAVLAFANLSDDRANEYFSDGISEELLTVLQKIPGLHVAARTSAFSFKGKNATAQAIGTTLNVAHLVEGSVQKIGNRVKISARLSRVATGEEVWSKSFGPLELTDVFATQSEIAQAIVGELRGRLAGGAVTEIATQVQAALKGGTKNSAAHDLFLQGQFHAARLTSIEVAQAIDLLHQSLAIDAGAAQTWVALARARMWQCDWEPLAPERIAEVRRAAEQAVALAPDLGVAQSTYGQVMQRYFREWRISRVAMNRALELAPADALVLSDVGVMRQVFSDLEGAIEMGRRALALDPFNAESRFFLSSSFLFAGRMAEARAEIQRAIQDAPGNNFLHTFACMVLLIDHQNAEALAEAKREPERMNLLTGLALAEFANGHRQAADEALEALKREFPTGAPYQVAWVYAFRNERDAAFEWLERGWQSHDPGVGWTRVDVFLKNLHDDPRWPVFLKKIGLSDEQLK